MTASPLHAADGPCRPKRDHYAGRGTERSRTAAHSGRAGCEQHDLVAGVGARVRGVSGISALNHGRHVPIFHQIRRPLSADGVGGLTASSPASLRRRKFFPVLTASGSRLSFGLLRFKPLQKSERVIANPTHFNPFRRFAGLVARFERHEVSERKIPNGDKPGARPGNLTARARNAY